MRKKTGESSMPERYFYSPNTGGSDLRSFVHDGRSNGSIQDKSRHSVFPVQSIDVVQEGALIKFLQEQRPETLTQQSTWEEKIRAFAAVKSNYKTRAKNRELKDVAEQTSPPSSSTRPATFEEAPAHKGGAQKHSPLLARPIQGTPAEIPHPDLSLASEPAVMDPEPIPRSRARPGHFNRREDPFQEADASNSG